MVFILESLQIAFVKNFFINFLNHFSGSYTRRILIEALALLKDLWPYLVSGIIVTSLIKVLLSKKHVDLLFQNRKNVSIIFAALLGVVSPLGSYTVIPMAAAMFILGTPLPVLMAFLVSSPLIDPNLFLLTAGAFGIKLAIVRTLAAFLLGVTAGYTTLWLMKKNLIRTESVIKSENGDSKIFSFQHHDKGEFFKSFGSELFKMTKYISKYFFLAILLAAGIKILTPPNMMLKLFNGNTFMSVLFSTGAGIPFYVCGGAAIPVVQELANLGMPHGAVLAFFISGPITKVSNLVLMNAAFNFRVFLIYITVGVIGASILGLIYNFC
jgi:uncharacterized membrane protein YraQ (UPF0718 family)